ncbi:uncharacterized protein LOC116430767 [Nomia melanderi]|uniref:uncharacterized protein LOC116430767 n=1 Tax=Nomia melanderi TaxID=2448451 RepID=UPI003FCEC32D
MLLYVVCVIQKKLSYCRLRNIKTKNLGGKGKLADALIRKLTAYYGLAIRRNIHSVENMKKAIIASYYHLCSTKENPRHEYCLVGNDSWCKWQKALATGANLDLIEHPAPLHPDVQKHILPIYEDLSEKNLFERCLGGHTQNNNESFNLTVWRFAPKHLHLGIKIIEIAAYLAAGLFNEGYASVLRTMSALNIVIGKQAKTYADKIDEQRIIRQERRTLLTTKEARKARREQRMEENQLYEETEGILYGAGIAD